MANTSKNNIFGLHFIKIFKYQIVLKLNFFSSFQTQFGVPHAVKIQTVQCEPKMILTDKFYESSLILISSKRHASRRLLLQIKWWTDGKANKNYCVLWNAPKYYKLIFTQYTKGYKEKGRNQCKTEDRYHSGTPTLGFD